MSDNPLDVAHVENVARVMCAAEGVDPDNSGALETPAWREYECQARAYIAALKSALDEVGFVPD
jgi:hypothetical protein